MSKSHWGGAVAQSFLETRYIPLTIVESLGAESLKFMARRLGNQELLVTDIGCGAGRLARGFLAESLEGRGPCIRVRYTGLDREEDMLRQASLLRMSGRCDLRLADCSEKGAVKSDSADLVILHWVLNATRRWWEVIRNAQGALRQGGAIMFLEEQGDLYRAIDGKPLDAEGGQIAQCWNNFWLSFYEGVDMTESDLRKRAGLSMNTRQVWTVLKNEGFTVQSRSDQTQEWQRAVDLEWVWKRVLKTKTFSNFSLINADRYERGLLAARRFLNEHQSCINERIVLKYQATPIFAYRS